MNSIARAAKSFSIALYVQLLSVIIVPRRQNAPSAVNSAAPGAWRHFVAVVKNIPASDVSLGESSVVKGGFFKQVLALFLTFSQYLIFRLGLYGQTFFFPCMYQTLSQR
jgi:hypothetical protein